MCDFISSKWRHGLGLLVILAMATSLLLNLNLQRHSTQAASPSHMASSQPSTVTGNPQAEQSLEGTVYIGGNNIVYALNAHTGHIRWSGPPGSDVESSPAVAG